MRSRKESVVVAAAPRILRAAFLSFSAVAETAPDISAEEYSADSSDTIDQIVVVAHKSERSILDIAANVAVVNRAGLKSQHANSVTDVCQYAPGIEYEAGGARFGTEDINIRGIGGNRVELIVDRVPLSDQFDVGSFSNATSWNL